MDTYFQKGFGLRLEVRPALAESYHSPVVARLKALGHDAAVAGVRLKLAQEFGFCYGVDRAVEYAYETRRQFPGRRIFLLGEIIHNPDVNARLTEMGIVILCGPVQQHAIDRDDVVILPAFGVTAPDMARLAEKQCVLVDTTCGSVLNVWKMVHRCASDGYTVVIHGKSYHEETRGTASQALTHRGGQYLCLRDTTEAGLVCGFLRGTVRSDLIRERLGAAASPGFDPDRDLRRIGLANQTTMLASESLDIQEMLRAAMADRVGDADLPHHFRAFDTICSATQDRQDAVRALLGPGDVDVMLVVGGYNSSNTQALAAMSARYVQTFHIEHPDCIDGQAICHRPQGGGSIARVEPWLPEGQITVGLTAGASTPDSVVGSVIDRVLAVRGYDASGLVAVSRPGCEAAR